MRPGSAWKKKNPTLNNGAIYPDREVAKEMKLALGFTQCQTETVHTREQETLSLNLNIDNWETRLFKVVHVQGCSTTHALLSVVHDWLRSMEDGHETGAVFTKAFDSVPHRQLVSKLRAIGLNKYFVSWITNYLTNRSQSVILSGETFGPLPVTSGVPQGSFLLYVNDVNDVNLSGGSKIILYADDI